MSQGNIFLQLINMARQEGRESEIERERQRRIERDRASAREEEKEKGKEKRIEKEVREPFFEGKTTS